MLNRVDYFEKTFSKLSVPAGKVSILVDGVLCSDLAVLQIVRASWPEFGWARLAYNPLSAIDQEVLSIEKMKSTFCTGSEIVIQQIYNGSAASISLSPLVIFCGHIEKVETSFGSSGSRVEFVARDFSAQMKRTRIYGCRVGISETDSFFLESADTVFNDDGEPNRSVEAVNRNQNSYYAFSENRQSAKLWDYAEVIKYLLAEYVVAGQLLMPEIDYLRSLTDGFIVDELDLTGLSLLEALKRCCENTGIKFRFEPAGQSPGLKQAIIFYKDGLWPSVELNCQDTGERLSVSETDIFTMNSSKELWPVTNNYLVQGDYKIYEATFELVQAWDPDDASGNYEDFSASTNPEFYKVKDVYRKWCLNEAGDYSAAPYNQGGAFDLSKIFEGGEFAHKRRKFFPALTTDRQNKSLGYFLEVSFDGGVNWWQYLYAFNNLHEECGIWLSSDQIDIDTWVAALKGVLKFRITAAVISDERITARVVDGPLGSMVPVVEHVKFLPSIFKFRKVSSESIFYNGSDENLGKADEIDDSCGLYEYARKLAISSAPVIEKACIHTGVLDLYHSPGAGVTLLPESRNLLGIRSDDRQIRWIERVLMDFEKQCTELDVYCKTKVEL